MKTTKKKDKNVTNATAIDWTPWTHTDEVPNFTISRKVLADAMKAAAKAVAGKSTLPVLSNVLIATKDGKLRLSATDLNIGVVLELEADVQQDGAITLPAKLLSEVVTNLIADTIVFTTDKRVQTGTLTCGRQRVPIRGIEADEFPTISSWSSDSKAFKFPGEEIMGALAFVAPATGGEDGRPILSGVHIQLKEGEMRVSGCDSYRLHSVVATNPTGEVADLIVPNTGIDYVLGAFSPKEEIVINVAPTNNMATFCQGNMAVTVRLMDGPYPDVVRIIPDKYNYAHRFVMAVDSLKQELKIAKLAAVQSQNVIRLTAKPGSITLTANAAEKMDYEGVIPTEIIREDGTEMDGDLSVHAINVEYLEDALQVVGTKTIEFRINNSVTPVVIREVGGHDGSVVVIMPMRPRN